VALSELAAAEFHWLVLEPSRDGSAATEFTAAEVTRIRTGGSCAKIVLAYLSIGEAEAYRDYWDPNWVDQSGDPLPGVAPAWLGPTNPDWAGNYKVRYWQVAWQALLFGTAGGAAPTPLDRIIDAGFDGVYLDIVDAYEYWSSAAGGAELTRMNARSLMIDLVEAIAAYARQTRGHADFLVFPQNAAEIIRDDDGQLDADSDRYFAAISGIGQEDLHYDELTPQPSATVAYTLAQLREYRSRGVSLAGKGRARDGLRD
jgi:cysteinyl-tRNA synthetase